MARFSISPPVAAEKFSPLAKVYDRTSQDGSIPIINYLLGSQYNVTMGGELNITSSGNITNDSVDVASGKLEVKLESVDGTEVTKIGTYATFSYLYPGITVYGHMELQDASLSSGTEKLRYVFEDLATSDKIIIELSAGASNNILKLIEEVDDVETTLATQNISATKTEVIFQLDYLKDGVTKLYYREMTGMDDKTRIFNGTITANVAEVKLFIKGISDKTSLKTLKSDFVWIFYPNIFISYDVDLDNRLNGNIKVWDTENEADEADWTRVYSSDHEFVGERVIENGLIRAEINTSPGVEIFGWDGIAWESTGTIKPIASNSDLGVTLHDVVFERFNDSQCKFIVKYGIVDHTIDMRRGNPYVRVVCNTKKFKIATSKQRFALSTKNTTTDIPDFNQKNTDDANRGNPANLSPVVNPFTFTDDSNATTGLDLINDNWFGWYDVVANDTIGWLGIVENPTGLVVTAVDATTLQDMIWTFEDDAIVSVGTLASKPTTVINGIPKPFNIGDVDTYVKWRANESIFSCDQKMFLKKKR